MDLRQALNDRTYEWTFMVNRRREKVERVNEFDKKMAFDSNGGRPLPNEGRGSNSPPWYSHLLVFNLDFKAMCFFSCLIQNIDALGQNKSGYFFSIFL